MPPQTSPRRANTASVQDIVPILKASFPAELSDEFKYPQKTDEFIEKFESLLRQLIAVTPHVTQTLVEQGLLSSFQKLEGAAATTLAKQISGAASFVFQKLKQTTSGKKLPDPLVRLIQCARQHFDRDHSKNARNVKLQRKHGFLAREKKVRTLKKQESDGTGAPPDRMQEQTGAPPDRMQEQAGRADDPVDEIARLRALYQLPEAASISIRGSSSSSEDMGRPEPSSSSRGPPVMTKTKRPLRACSSASLQGLQHATSVPAAAVASKTVEPHPVIYVFMNAQSGQIVRNVSGAEQVADEVRSGNKGFMQARFGPDWLETSVANITYNMRQKTLKAAHDPVDPAPLQRARGKQAADKAAAKAKGQAKAKAKGKAANKAKAKAKGKDVPSKASGAGSEPAAEQKADEQEVLEDPPRKKGGRQGRPLEELSWSDRLKRIASRAYHNARDAAALKGMDTEACKAEGSKASLKAREDFRREFPQTMSISSVRDSSLRAGACRRAGCESFCTRSTSFCRQQKWFCTF